MRYYYSVDQLAQIPAGTHIKTFSPQYGVDHHANFAGVWQGRGWVYHSVKPGGYVLAPSEDFHHGYELIVVAAPIRGSEHQRQILRRVEAALGTKWTLLASNCEHVASWVFGGRSESKQVQIGVGLVSVIGLLAVAALDKPKYSRHW